MTAGDADRYHVDKVVFVSSSAGKESACNVEDLGLIPGLGRSSGEEKGYPLQYSSLEKSMGSQSRTQLSDFHCSLKLPFSSLFYSVFWKHVSKFRVRGTTLYLLEGGFP